MLVLLDQAQDFKPVGEKVLAAFHDWVESGSGGASNWSLTEVNHEGWRVSFRPVCHSTHLPLS